MRSCQYCGTLNRTDATYCNSCGGALLPAGHSAASQGARSTAQATPRPTTATGRLAPQSQLKGGRYLILKNAGQGGMAAVYKATNVKTHTVVAIKEMSQDGLSPEDLREALESFTAEARLLTALSHRNLPKVYESFSEGGRHYLVMDFIEGQTLEERQRAAHGAALPEGEVVEWARQTCEVLSYLHAQKPPIIFRDLKPANIMLTPGGQIKLIDFGIARVFAPGRVRDTQVLGTPGFAPPEQYGKTQTDARADIYALGCTLYQLLTGYDPATTPFALPPIQTRNPNISMQVRTAIERAIQLDRDARYSNVDDFARALVTSPPYIAAASQRKAQGAPRTTIPHAAVPPSAARPAASARPATATNTRPAAAAQAAPTTMAAIVVVQPHSVDFGRLVQGQRGTVSITIGGQGGARVRGQIKSDAPWLTMDRDRFDGASTFVQLIAETRYAKKTGSLRATVQINCDGQYLSLPVTVEVVAAQVTRSQANTAATGKGATAVPHAVTPKYTGVTTRRPRLVWFGLALALGIGVAAQAMPLEQTAVQRWAPHVAVTAPVMLGLLLLTALLAGASAFAASGTASRRGRLPTALLGALLGLAGALFANGAWLWSSPATLLTHPVQMPANAHLLTALLLGLGGAFGAEPLGSLILSNVLAFVGRYIRSLTALALIIAGGWTGATLGASMASCLMLVGLLGGAWSGYVLGRFLGLSLLPTSGIRWRNMPRARSYRTP